MSVVGKLSMLTLAACLLLHLTMAVPTCKWCSTNHQHCVRNVKSYQSLDQNVCDFALSICTMSCQQKRKENDGKMEEKKERKDFFIKLFNEKELN